MTASVRDPLAESYALAGPERRRIADRRVVPRRAPALRQRPPRPNERSLFTLTGRDSRHGATPGWLVHPIGVPLQVTSSVVPGFVRRRLGELLDYDMNKEAPTW